jgi:hypothetical protein
MTNYFVTQIKDHLLQDDIVFRNQDQKDENIPSLGVEITANRNIAQNKNELHITIVEIIPIQEYLSVQWATEKLRKFIIRKYVKIFDRINELTCVAVPELNPHSKLGLIELLKESDPLSILDFLRLEKPKPEVLCVLSVIGEFAFVRKLAFLFSKMEMLVAFEDPCKVTTNLSFGPYYPTQIGLNSEYQHCLN